MRRRAPWSSRAWGRRGRRSTWTSSLTSLTPSWPSTGRCSIPLSLRLGWPRLDRSLPLQDFTGNGRTLRLTVSIWFCFLLFTLFPNRPSWFWICFCLLCFALLWFDFVFVFSCTRFCQLWREGRRRKKGEERKKKFSFLAQNRISRIPPLSLRELAQEMGQGL